MQRTAPRLVQFLLCLWLLVLTGAPGLANTWRESSAIEPTVHPSARAALKFGTAFAASEEDAVYHYDAPAALRKYLYCQGNPIMGIDPSGHDGWDLGSLDVNMFLRTALAAFVITATVGEVVEHDPIIWVTGSGVSSTGTQTGTGPMPQPQPEPTENPPPVPWPDPIPPTQGRWGFFVHYSAKSPDSFAFGIMIPPRTWVTDILNSGLDAETAYNDFNLFQRPKYEYLFRINFDMLGPVDNSNPGRRAQYEVLSPTGVGSLITWRNVPAHR